MQKAKIEDYAEAKDILLKHKSVANALKMLAEPA